MRKLVAILIVLFTIISCESEKLKEDISGKYLFEIWSYDYNSVKGLRTNRFIELRNDNTFSFHNNDQFEDSEEYKGNWNLEGDILTLESDTFIHHKNKRYDRLIKASHNRWEFELRKDTLTLGAYRYIRKDDNYD